MWVLISEDLSEWGACWLADHHYPLSWGHLPTPSGLSRRGLFRDEGSPGALLERSPAGSLPHGHDTHGPTPRLSPGGSRHSPSPGTVRGPALVPWIGLQRREDPLPFGHGWGSRTQPGAVFSLGKCPSRSSSPSWALHSPFQGWEVWARWVPAGPPPGLQVGPARGSGARMHRSQASDRHSGRCSSPGAQWSRQPHRVGTSCEGGHGHSPDSVLGSASPESGSTRGPEGATGKGQQPTRVGAAKIQPRG